VNVTALLAHPDDETMAAGTLAKFRDEGHTVTLVTVFTDERAVALRKCAKILDVNLIELSCDESRFVWCQETVRELEPVVLGSEPDLLLSHRMADTNTSHVPLAQLARTVCRKNNLSLWEVDVPMPGGLDTDGPANNLLVDIDGQAGRKIAALACYELPYRGWREANSLRDTVNGWLLCMEPGHMAEAFRIVKAVW
jgi:LmbE family N-acetylglucosaminyl deacetylase